MKIKDDKFVYFRVELYILHVTNISIRKEEIFEMVPRSEIISPIAWKRFRRQSKNDPIER